MKILNLYFKNINSLEGENRIDFDQPPFSDTGVFAITGPNGSGKSSILDAITLALYGETFRFDKPAQHIITQHTAESFSQIEFTLGDDKYRSSWQVRRENGNPRGDVLPTEMKLLRLSNPEEIVATSPQQVCSRMVDITGMNFHSFTRSILLAQGEFAAFLNALSSERMAILENIISSDIYTDYKNEVLSKQAGVQQKLSYLQQDLVAVPLIERESFEACEMDLADFSEQTADFQEQINGLKQLKCDLAETADIKQRISACEASLQAAITERLVVQKRLDQLNAAENALQFQEDIDAIEQKQAIIDHENAELSVLQNEAKQIQGTLALPGFDTLSAAQRQDVVQRPDSFVEQKQTIDSLKSQIGLFNANWQSEIILQKSLANQIAEKESELTEISAWLADHASDALLLTDFPQIERLKNVRILLDEIGEKKQALEKWSKQTRSALQKNQDHFEKKNEKIEQLNNSLAEEEQKLAELAQGNTIEEIEELQVEQKERVQAFEELVNLSVASEKMAPKPSFFAGLFGKQSTGPIRDEQELQNDLETLREQIRRDENIRLSLEKAMFNDALLTRMAQDRHLLIDGKPCPLCGATEHPYAKRPPVPANTQQALIDQRIKIKRLNAEIADLEQQLKMAQKRVERSHASHHQLQQIRTRWLTLCNQLNASSQDLDIHKTSMVKDMLKSEEADLKNIAILLTKYKDGEKRIAKLQSAIEKTKGVVEQSQSSIQLINAEWQTAPQKIAEAEASEAAAQMEEQELVAKLTLQLQVLGEELPRSGKEEVLLNSLKLRAQDYGSYDLRKRNLAEDVGILSARLKEGQVQIDGYKARLDALNKQLNVEEVVGLHLALVEKQKLVADKERQVRQLKLELAELGQAFAKKMAGTQFANAGEIKQVLMLLDDQPQVVQQYSDLDQQAIGFEQELETLHVQLENLEGKTKLELSNEEIEFKIKAANEKMALAQMEAERLERIVREQKQFKEKYDGILQQIESQQLLLQQADAEVAEISAENGMAFRRRVQERMIEKLLSQTNATLEKISGRYYLRQRPSDRGLALEIEDTYQGNLRRLPKTLSGGESFIVSLALALGLSELANNGRSVDSLFLDEGFGNLDAETLYTVINTLESLRAFGKTVGVISHVEAVQRRFKAQLQLVKKPNGLGELRKVS